jgi:hypothetical protein
MKPDAHFKDSRPLGAAATQDAGAPPATGPIDADWPQHERAARGHRAPDDDAEDDDVYGDPSKVKDEGPLESFGKAISAPVRDAAAEDAAPDPKAA